MGESSNTKNKLKSDEKTEDVYTKNMLVRRIAKSCDRNTGTVQDVYDAMEQTIFELLSSATLNRDILIKLFEGISLSSSYIPEKIKTNNLTGKFITVSNKIKPKVNITRRYCDKLTYNSNDK